MHVLIVDDEKDIREVLIMAIRELGHEVHEASSAEDAIACMRKRTPDLLITDIAMEGLSGLELLSKAKHYFPTVTTVILTAQSSIKSAVEAIRAGAFDYLPKPISLEDLERVVGQVGRFRSLQAENAQLKSQMAQLEHLAPPSAIVTSSARLNKILDIAEKVAQTDATLLITGESGTGKTMLARMIHDKSQRSHAPFAVVNCATLSENLLESELFGHVRGSFTGAIKDKTGRLQAAEKGTVFLDEIGEISPALQTKLLRFLQDREFERVGDTKTIKVDVRIVAATNKNLELEVSEGRFREDLYFRLNVIELRMPSLRERKEDISVLVQHLIAHSFAILGKSPRTLSEQAAVAIAHYDWPGNIRELKNAMERAAILSTSDQISLDDLPDRLQVAYNKAYAPTPDPSEGAAGSGTFVSPGLAKPQLQRGGPLSLDELERKHIETVLSQASTLEDAASILGINLSTLWRKRRAYGMGISSLETKPPIESPNEAEAASF